ncbi:MAG: NfeD family protein [Elainella sp. Prado103]|nr:NfeD family protein [Elainella sp. Prado103]
MSAPIFWLTVGLILCLMELVIPTAFIELTMGISAILVAMVAWFIPPLTVQVMVWIVLSIGLTLLLRRLLPKRKRVAIEDAKEAKTLTAIAPGSVGRVIYEGNSWQARCEDDQLEIAPNQKVYVVGRRGTTLLVLPESIVHL